jgi:predicted O-methyltransferase YrrM
MWLISKIRKWTCDVLHAIGVLEVYQISKYGYLHQLRWRESFKEPLPTDINGNLIPWMNYNLIDFLKERVQPQFRIFEYGSGASTCWWAGLAAEVVACEHDEEWFERMKPAFPDNVIPIHVPLVLDGNYCRTITTQKGEFDIVVSDGRDRIRCLLNAIPYLSSGGVMILDDFERSRYRQARELLSERGFRCLVIKGMKPQSLYESQAVIFYRPDNVLDL